MISGGLDSILAARIIKEQGIDVLPLNFKIPFFHRKKHPSQENALISFVQINLGQDLKTVDISADFLELILSPKHGFGSNMNPCIDCKIFMLKKARGLMEPWGAQFVVTGEVLGQRPMSQHRRALEMIGKESGLEGLLLRPLCAGGLAETIPEKLGWLKRSALFKFSGRTRRPQMALARKLNIENYPNAAGGCLLTDAQFSHRLRDLISHQGLSVENIGLLKIGRHFRLAKNTKLIVGRDEGENKELESAASSGDYLFMPNEDLAGPSCLGRGEFNEELIKISSQITCRYCDLSGSSRAKIIYFKVGQVRPEKLSLEVSSASEEKLKALRL